MNGKRKQHTAEFRKYAGMTIEQLRELLRKTSNPTEVEQIVEVLRRRREDELLNKVDTRKPILADGSKDETPSAHITRLFGGSSKTSERTVLDEGQSMPKPGMSMGKKVARAVAWYVFACIILAVISKCSEPNIVPYYPYYPW